MLDNDKSPKRRHIEELIFIKIPHVIVGMLFFVAATINIINVIGRYIFSVPVFWAEEVLTFIIMWAVFMIAGTITYRGAHLNMDLLYNAFSPPWKRIVNIAVVGSLIGCAIFTAIQSWKVIGLHVRNHAVTASTDIPLVYPHTAILFGFSFIAVAAILRIKAYITGNFD